MYLPLISNSTETLLAISRERERERENEKNSPGCRFEGIGRKQYLLLELIQILIVYFFFNLQ